MPSLAATMPEGVRSAMAEREARVRQQVVAAGPWRHPLQLPSDRYSPARVVSIANDII